MLYLNLTNFFEKLLTQKFIKNYQNKGPWLSYFFIFFLFEILLTVSSWHVISPHFSKNILHFTHVHTKQEIIYLASCSRYKGIRICYLFTHFIFFFFFKVVYGIFSTSCFIALKDSPWKRMENVLVFHNNNFSPSQDIAVCFLYYLLRQN